jgi:hypothetical protein
MMNTTNQNKMEDKTMNQKTITRNQMDQLTINTVAFKKFCALTDFIEQYPDRITFTVSDTDHDGLSFLDNPDDFRTANEHELRAAILDVIHTAQDIIDNHKNTVPGKKLAGLVANRLSGNSRLLAEIIAGDPDYVRMDVKG